MCCILIIKKKQPVGVKRIYRETNLRGGRGELNVGEGNPRAPIVCLEHWNPDS